MTCGYGLQTCWHGSDVAGDKQRVHFRGLVQLRMKTVITCD